MPTCNYFIKDKDNKIKFIFVFNVLSDSKFNLCYYGNSIVSSTVTVEEVSSGRE